MPDHNAPDMQQGYRMFGKLREIALGTNDHPEGDEDLIYAAKLGHVEHDGERWVPTDQGRAVYEQVAGEG